MGAQASGCRDLGVPPSVGDHRHLHPGGQCEAGVGVSKVMEPSYRKSQILRQGLEVPGGHLWHPFGHKAANLRNGWPKLGQAKPSHRLSEPPSKAEMAAVEMMPPIASVHPAAETIT